MANNDCVATAGDQCGEDIDSEDRPCATAVSEPRETRFDRQHSAGASTKYNQQRMFIGVLTVRAFICALTHSIALQTPQRASMAAVNTDNTTSDGDLGMFGRCALTGA